MPDLNKEALENLRLLAERATERAEHVVIEPDIFTELINKYPMTTITTLEELEELPVQSVILDSENEIVVRRSGTFSPWVCALDGMGYTHDQQAKFLPARVLYKGEK